MTGPNLIKEVGPEDREGDMPDSYSNFEGDPYAFSRRSNREVMWLTHTYRLPTVVKLSLAYSLYTGERTNWLASGELWRPSYIPISYAAGTELTYNFDAFTSAALRMGWMVQFDEYDEAVDQFGYEYLGDDPTFRGFSLGGGIQRTWYGKTIRFNYAYRNKGRLSADNFFTITLGF